MIQVQCPSCAKTYQVPEEKLGSQAKCKSCAQKFTLAIATSETHSPPVGSSSELAPATSVNADNGSRSTPDRVAHYVLKRKLGAGAMGEVWLAADSMLERDVAVKLIPATIARDPERRNRFLREAKLAAKLSHPNAVTVHHAGIENDSVFVVMELVDGESLDKTVATQGLLDWREATRVIGDAAQGLAAAHELGLVHRDIKPANLMRTTKGVTKVVDFGLAREVLSDAQLSREGMLLGTPAYMAPEQWTGGEADARSDLYSLICTYYFLLTGRLPFEAPALPSLGYQHRYEPFPDPSLLVPDLPPEISRLISRGSQKEPAHRYQDATELIADLEKLLKVANETATSTTGSNPPPILVVAMPNTSSRVASRHKSLWSIMPPRWRWLAMCGCAFALLAASAIVILVRKPEGTIEFKLSDPQAKVEFKVDGNLVEAWENGKPLRFRVGEHQLLVAGENFETVVETFKVMRGANPAYQVRLVPLKASVAATAPSAGAMPGSQRGMVSPVIPRYRTVDRKEATITATSQWPFSMPVRRGQRLRITATGSYRIRTGGVWHGPNEAEFYLQGRLGAEPPFRVGANLVLDIKEDGVLALGIREGGTYANNEGGVRTSIEVSELEP